MFASSIPCQTVNIQIKINFKLLMIFKCENLSYTLCKLNCSLSIPTTFPPTVLFFFSDPYFDTENSSLCFPNVQILLTPQGLAEMLPL